MWKKKDPVSYQESNDPNTDTRSDIWLCYVKGERRGCLNETINFFIEDYLLIETHIFNNDTCTVMFLHNLAQPQWSHIPCGEKVIGHTFCSIKENSKTNYTSIQTTAGVSVCQKGFLKKNKICFELIWHTYIPGLSNRRTLSIHIFNSLFKFVMNVIKSNVNLPFYSHHLGNILIIKKPSVSFGYVKKPIKERARAFLFRVDTLKEFSIPKYLFLCERDRYMIFVDIFDNYNDCHRFKALNTILQNKMRNCSQLFHSSRDGFCKLYISLDYKVKKLPMLKKIIPYKKHTRNVSTNLFYHECSENGQFSCLKGMSQCFTISDICHYKLDISNKLVPCETGTHLYNCKDFECDMKFKCSGFYCISWSYVCNGKWDCPGGSDKIDIQQCGQFRKCKHMLKCKASQICIHLGDLCDGVVDCPDGNDEASHCMWNIPLCPNSCECLLSAVKCFEVPSNVTDIIKHEHFPFFAVFIESSGISRSFLSLDSKMNEVNNIFVLVIRNSKIVQPCYLTSKMVNLVSIDFSLNIINDLQNGCYTNSLKIITLSNNLISHIIHNVFSESKSLLSLDLSNNPLRSLSDSSTFKMPILQILSIQNNSLHYLKTITFHLPKLLVLKTENFRLCCFISDKAKCTSQIPWFISCENILSNKAIKITFYCVSSLIILLNIISILLQVIIFEKNIKKNSSFGIIIGAVNISDLMLSIPLCILWSADLYYRGFYIMNDIDWRSGILCFIVFGMNINFHLMSPLLFLFMSFSRLMVVSHPLDSKFKNSIYVLKYVLSIFTLSIIMSIVTTIIVKTIYESVPMQFCSPFIDLSNSLALLNIISWFIAILQIVAVIIIIVIYCLLLKDLKYSQQKMKESVSKKTSYVGLTVQIIVVTGSNLLCWIPSSIIYLVSNFLNNYPIEMIMWTIIAVVPINCIVNPIVFIVTTLRTN